MDELVSVDNFYPRVNHELDLHFLYPTSQKNYGTQGPESIVPVTLAFQHLPNTFTFWRRIFLANFSNDIALMGE